MNRPTSKNQGFEPQGIILPMTLSVGFVVLVLAVVLGLDLSTDPKVHALFESTMQLMLVFILISAFQGLRREKDGYMLAALLAFTGAFFLDMRHLLFAAENFSDVFGINATLSDNGDLGWLAPRLYLSVMLLLFVAYRQIEELLQKANITVFSFFAPVAFVLLFVCDSVATWATMYINPVPAWNMYHPAELLPGAISLLAVAAYVQAGNWRESIFHVYLICGLLVNSILHLAVMPFSREVFDSYYAAAHFLKFVSYIAFLAGFITRGRESARALLTQERQRSRSVLEIVPDGIFTLDGRGVIQTINPAGCTILGSAPDELVGQDIKSWIPELNPHGEGPLEISNNSLYHSSLQLEGQRSNGSTVPLEISLNIVDQDNENKLFVGVIRDISERQQRELELKNLALQLETALVAAGLGSWEWDATSNTTSWDAQSRLIFGLKHVAGNSTMSREDVLALVHPDEIEQVDGMFSSSNIVDAKFRDQEYRIRRESDGAQRWISSSGALLFDDQGELLRVVGVHRDVTQFKEDIAQLTAAREEAREASRIKSAFLANMSHEIRTPMNGVIGMLDVLQQSSLNSRQMNMTDLIKESSLSLLNLIDDILDFSKIEAGKLNIVAEPMSLTFLVESVGSSLDTLAIKQGVELSLFTDPKLPRTVMADSNRLRQILVNLVNNGIKFSSSETRTGKVALRALLIAQDQEQVTVEFRVIDNGIGMDEDTQSAVFESFVQADDSTQRRFGGTGLGLAISNSLIKMMNGKIQLTSAPGKGTEFSVQLTLAHAQQTEQAANLDVNLANLTCLLVADPEGGSEDLAAYLEDAGADIRYGRTIAETVDWPGWERENGVVCVIDRGTQAISADNLEMLKSSPAAVILIERGRGQQIVPFEPLLRIDGNVLARHDFLTAVAQTAGGIAATLDTEPTVGDDMAAAETPSREEAIASEKLILVVEDNSINQIVIREQLSTLGYVAEVANNGMEGLEHWKRGGYALILTDLQMPELDGYEMSVQIREQEPDGERIPIVALSASAMLGEADRCEAAGMDGFLPKPARMNDLETELKRWLPGAASDEAENAKEKSGNETTGEEPVRLQVLTELVGGRSTLIASLLQEYRVTTFSIREQLLEAWCDGRLADVSKHAHKLKSSSNTIGAMVLGGLCQEVEHAGREFQAKSLAELVPRLEAEIIAVDNFIASMEAPAA